MDLVVAITIDVFQIAIILANITVESVVHLIKPLHLLFTAKKCFLIMAFTSLINIHHY